VTLRLGGKDVDVTDDVAEGTPDLLSIIRDVVRAELAEFKAALPPFLQPDEDEEEEEETEDAATEEVEDATDPEEGDEDEEPVASLPPETTPDEPVAEDDSAARAAAESEEIRDAFSQIVAQLVSPSPSADDVLNRLKEAL
jgi:hypothetical protein